ncbi:MAG: threonine/serine exporter family protein [Oscillospiraceae bacterium]
MLEQLLYQMLISLVSSVSFAVLCNVPKGTVAIGGVIGMVGWVGYWLIIRMEYSIFVASFVCALILTSASHLASIFFKKPMIVFFVPGLVPVVPGITFYEAFRSLIQGEYLIAGKIFLNVLYTAVGIASAFVIASSFFKVYHLIRIELKRRRRLRRITK